MGKTSLYQVIPVRQRGGRQQVRSGSVTLAKTRKDRRKTGTGGPRGENHGAPETLSLQDEMRERINTFETVFNVDQFLVRLLGSLGEGRVQGLRSASDLFGCLFTPTGPPQACSQHSSVYSSLVEAPTWLN